MTNAYVEQRDGGYWIRGTRISLDSVVYAFWRGAAPESIVRSFPLLTLEQVYGSIAYYLAHQQDVDAYLQHEEREYAVFSEESRAALRKSRPALFTRVEAAREQPETSPS